MCSQNSSMLSRMIEALADVVLASFYVLKIFQYSRLKRPWTIDSAQYCQGANVFLSQSLAYSCKALKVIATDIFIENRRHLKFYHWGLLYLYLIPSVFFFA